MEGGQTVNGCWWAFLGLWAWGGETGGLAIQWIGGGVVTRAKTIRDVGRRVYLQARDLDLFGFVADQRFVTRRQLCRRFWPGPSGKSDQVGYRRLLLLRRHGLLETRHVPTDAEQIFQLGKLGRKELEADRRAVLPYLSGIDLRNFRHDSLVTDVRIEAEVSLQTAWRSERRLHQERWQGHAPDGLFVLGQYLFALELELSVKPKEKLRAIFASNREKNPEVYWLYLAATPRIGNLVLERAPANKRYWVGQWDDWKTFGLSAMPWRRFDETELRLNQVTRGVV